MHPLSENSRPRPSGDLDRGFREIHHQSRTVHTNCIPLANRQPLEGVPLPTSPPYTAFVGNLPFSVTESEVAAFFDVHEVRHGPLTCQPKIECSSGCFTDQIHQNHH